ncbi:hypothetical protein BMS3Bbin01_00874 [bacterium BMS3Bbin01]|nr:hypothetical protein BMS3Bbin01_00874 [bacterium BMS3Bbin01]
MAKFHSLSDQEIEAILNGSALADLADVAALVERIRDTCSESVDPALGARQIVAAAEAARLSPRPARSRESKRYRWRRRTVFTSFIFTILTKVLAASVALAAVTGGVGAIANQSAPGDPLYGVDIALEHVGVFNGGTTERLQEAQRLVAQDHIAEGLEFAGKAIGRVDRDRGLEQAASALEEAAAHVAAQHTDAKGYQATQEYRDQVAEMLRLMSQEMKQQDINVQHVAETARQVRETTQEMTRQMKQEVGRPTTTITVPEMPTRPTITVPEMPTRPTITVPAMPTMPTNPTTMPATSGSDAGLRDGTGDSGGNGSGPGTTHP